MILTLRPEVVLEIGVFEGKSLIPMAMAMKEIGYGTIIGVDAWSKQVAIREQITPEHQAWWANLDIDRIYNNFIGHLSRYDLNKHVQVVRQESQNFTGPAAYQIFHCDGSHSPTTINDILRFAPKVVMGGLVILDDIDGGSHGQAPAMAAQRLIQMRFKKLYNLQDGAVFQRQ